MRFLRKIISATLVMIMGCSLLVGCGKLTSDDDTLKIYYVKNAIEYDKCINQFQVLNKDIKCDITTFDSEKEMGDKISLDMASDDGPDIIFLSYESTINIEKAMDSGKFLDLSSYIAGDEDFNDDSYFMNIINACKRNDELTVMPFNFDINVFCYQNNKADAFKELDSKNLNYCYFVNYIDECQSSLLSDDMNMAMTTLGAYISQKDLLVCLINDMGLNVINHKNEVTLKKEDLKTLCSITKKIKDENEKKFEYLNANMSANTMYNYFDSFVTNYNDTPISLSLISANSFDSQDIQFSGIPNSQGEGYTAFITNYGVINKQCKNADKAYRLLKYISGYRADYSSRLYMSVNKDIYNDKIEEISNATSWTMSSGKTYKLRKWDDETKTKFKYIIDNIKYVHINNTYVENIISDSMKEYIDNTKDFDECYDDLLFKLNLYINE